MPGPGDDLDSRFDLAIPKIAGAQDNAGDDLDSRFERALPSTGLLKQAGRVPLPKAKNLASDAISAIPYIASAGAGLATGGMGFIPAVAASAAAGGVGAAAEQGVRKLTGVYAPTGEEAKNAIISGVEQGAGAEFGGRTLNALLGATVGKYLNAKKLYQGALKPTGGSEYSAEKVIDAGIKHGAMPSFEGREAMVQLGKRADDTVARMIAASPSDIPPAQYVKNIETEFDRLRAQWGSDPQDGGKFIAQLDRHEKNFLIDHGNVQPIQKQVLNPSLGNTPQTQTQTVVIEPKDMTLQELRANAQPLPTTSAQDIKKQAWETVRTQAAGAFEEGSHPGLATEARQTIGRVLKKNLEQIYPQIKATNQVSGEAKSLETAIDHFLKVQMNKQDTPYFIYPIVGALAGGGAGAYHGGGGGAEAGAAVGAAGMHMVRAALEDPVIKARIAILLDRFFRSSAGKIASKVGSQVLPDTIRLGEYVKQEREAKH